jgi:plasmid stabilization system protein ParE
MTVKYSKRALADPHHIAEYYATTASPDVAKAVVAAIRAVVARVTRHPESGRQVVQRPPVRVALLPRYRDRIFLPEAGRCDPRRQYSPHLAAFLALGDIYPRKARLSAAASISFRLADRGYWLT